MAKQAGSTRQSQISPRPELSDAEFVDQLLAMLAGNYANSALSASDLTTTNLFQDELGEMVRVHDRERVAIAVRTAIRTVKRFLPEVAVIWELIPPAPDKPRFDPSCGKCGGTGWKYLPAATGSPTRVDRCNCAPMRARSA